MVEHVDAVEDWIDGMPVDPSDRHAARVEELRELLSFGAFHAVKYAEAVGKPIFPFKWVERIKDGVIKARVTVADVKHKSCDEAHEVFAPTPSLMASTLFEAVVIRRGFVSFTADVVSAFPHAAEKDIVYMRTPKEFAEACGTEYVKAKGGLSDDILGSSGALLRLRANVYGRRVGPKAWREKF